MLAFVAGISLSASTSKRGHVPKLDLVLLQDLVLEFGPASLRSGLNS